MLRKNFKPYLYNKSIIIQNNSNKFYPITQRFLTSSFSRKFPKDFIPAAQLSSPILPGTISHIFTKSKLQRFRSFKMALFFSKKTDFAQISSFEDIHPIGTLAEVTLISRIIGETRIQFNCFQAVKAVKVIRGLVKVEKFGDNEIKTLSYKMMPTDLMSKFLLARDIIYNINNNRIFLRKDKIQTVENLRSVLNLVFSDKNNDVQNILEKKTIEESLEEILKFAQKQELFNTLFDTHLQKCQSEEKKQIKKMHIQKQISSLQSQVEGTSKNGSKILLDRLKGKTPPKEVIEAIKNLDHKNLKDDNMSNFYYCEILSKIPWGVHSKDNFDLTKAREILNRDHFGIKEVKNRIIEFIASGKLKKSIIQGKIICLVGPPGVGKTSIAKSIADSLGKKFCRMSIGGVEDITEIKGHRKTYVGSMPGQIVMELIKAQTMNPLFLIDEIDKFEQVSKGNIGSTLLDLFDHSQNSQFVDHFVQHPLDVSKVLFICTANSLDPIPATLLDRMETIEISGYTDREKAEICKKYIFPKVAKQIGIDIEKVNFSDSIIKNLILDYCRESGLRSLEKAANKIFRKIAVKIIDSREKNYDINLKEYLGPKPFTMDKLFKTPPVGVIAGLSYSQMGGNLMYIESTQSGQKEEEPSIKTTGSLGKVLTESVSVAHIIAQKFFAEFLSKKFPPNASSNNKNEPPSIFNAAGDEIDRDFFRHKIHVHLPEGAVPKDGPSAGVALAVSLFSLACRTAVRPSLCFTGEISLSGKVLAVGGLKEKLLAAKRSGLKEVLLPKENEGTLRQFEKEYKEGIRFHFVDDVKEVFKIAFPWVGENLD